jgi:hypothetical protein
LARSADKQAHVPAGTAPPPVAAYVKTFIIAAAAIISAAGSASAADMCRRYVPSAGTTIEVPCVEPTTTKESVKEPAPVVTASVQPTPAAPPADPVAAPAPKATPTVAKEVPAPAQPTNTAEHTRDAKRCGEILDRAQTHKVTAADLNVLRTQCRS